MGHSIVKKYTELCNIGLSRVLVTYLVTALPQFIVAWIVMRHNLPNFRLCNVKVRVNILLATILKKYLLKHMYS